MTVLNFAITADGAFVATDSLVTLDGSPSFFTSKAVPVPHLNGLICGTGLQAFIHRWTLTVLGGVVAVDMPDLDQFASEGLRRIWSQMSDEERGAGTSTVYHFGYDQETAQFVGFAYRSTNDFVSEPLPHGVATKPPYLGDLPMLGFPNDFVEVCRAQRIEQDDLPPDERVYIGGQIVAYMMLANREEGREPIITTTVQVAFDFEDFERMYWQCLSSLEPD